MQRAHHILSGGITKLVEAEDFTHKDYGGHFQCPHCHETLTLRKFKNRDKKKPPRVKATFVHPKGHPADCYLRAPSSTSTINNDVLDIVSRGQSSKKLEMAFLKCLKFLMGNFLEPLPFSKVGFVTGEIGFFNPQHNPSYLKKYLNYNATSGRVHDHPDLLVEGFSKLIESPNAKTYINELVSDYQATLLEKKDELKYFTLESTRTGISTDNLVSMHCSQLSGIVRYICTGASSELRKSVLEILVWVDHSNLPVLREFFETQKDKKLFKNIPSISTESADIQRKRARTKLNKEEREQQIQRIRKFDHALLSQLVSDKNYVENAFSLFYKDESTHECDMIEFILDKIVDSLRMYNWAHLSRFYNEKGSKWDRQRVGYYYY